MYKLDAKVPSLSGPLTTIEVKLDITVELASKLDKSVLGASSRVYYSGGLYGGRCLTLITRYFRRNTRKRKA